jgi:hypothetical protein
MIKKNGKIRFYRAMTLLELVLAMVMITIIFAAVFPQFAVISKNWDIKQGSAEAIQNGRVLMDHISRNLSKAKRITVVSDSSVTNGYIQFVDNNDVNDRYDIASSDSYVEYGPVGTLSDLAGPVSSFQFTCYDVCDNLLSPVTDANAVRLIKINATFTNSASLGEPQPKTLTTWAYLWTNGKNQGCWQDQDIGSVAAAGSATSANSNWTIVGSGADIWDTSDGFHYVYQSLSGNGQIVARVTSITNTNAWAKAGVMIRETLTGGSEHAMMIITPGQGTDFQYRASTNGSSTSATTNGTGSSIAVPYWVKLTRVGNTFTGYHSPDGSTWTQIGSASITMATSAYIGLAVTSHNDGTLCTANFDNISFITYDGFSAAKCPSDSNTSVTISTPATDVGDLLIAAVATNGSTTISPPSGWTLINQGSDSSGQVTLGAWWRFAVASEPASHQFIWPVGQKAYGWMMRFKGQNVTSPINTFASASSSGTATPTSPAVTTTTNCCQILRLGAFDNSDITVGNTGLSGNTTITMDASGGSVTIPTYQAAGTAMSGTAAITVAWPAHQAGDIALLFVESCGGEAVTLSTPAGFVNVLNSPQSTGTTTNGTRLTVFWCRATSSSMSSPTVADPGNHVYGIILTFRNVVATGNPWDITAGGTKATASTTTTFGTVTTNVNNDLIVLAASRDNDSAAAAWSAWTNANLSGLTERSDGGTTSGNGGGVGVATGLKATAGSVGSSTATVTSSVDGHMTIALAPIGDGTVSGGAGYVRQASAGSSGTSTFSLTAPDPARMLTIAIAPSDPNNNACCQSNILP